MLKTKKRTVKQKRNSDGKFAPVESLEAFIARGGKVKVCPPGNAEQALPNTTYIDGGVFVNQSGIPEYVPNYVVSEVTWNSAQDDRPDVLIALAQREKEIDSLPAPLRRLASKRSPDAFESTGEEISNYYDEIEPED